MFAHRGSTWTWSKWENVQNAIQEAKAGVGILLHELCVVDVDDVAISSSLEVEFPDLCRAVCEETRRGRHYLFSRTVLADELGCYDARCPQRPGIDFKTITRSGTGGFIVVAPSPGKSWIRPPWTTPLTPIPDALLIALCSPRPQPCLSAVFVFTDEPGRPTLSVEKNPWLAQMDTLIPFFEVDDDSGHGHGHGHGNDIDMDPDVPVGIQLSNCDPINLAALLRVCEVRDIPDVTFLAPLKVQSLQRHADFLGLAPRATQCLRPPFGSLYRRADLASLDSEWIEVSLRERLPKQAQARTSPLQLVEIDIALADELRFEPFPVGADVDTRWLFSMQPLQSRMRSTPVRAGDHVLFAKPRASLVKTLHPFVRNCLLLFHDNLVVAGGAALAALCPFVSPGDDSDLFIYGIDSDGADCIVASLLELADLDGAHVAAHTQNAVTLCLGDGTLVQVVLRLHATPVDVISSFDLAPCKVLVKSDSKGNLTAWCLPSFCASLRRMAMWVDSDATWSRGSVIRILKYYAKGFEVFVPGTRRAAMRMEALEAPLSRVEGLAALFVLEHRIQRDLLYRRLAPKDVPRYARLDTSILWGASDYGLVPSFLRRFRCTVQHAYRWVTGQTMDDIKTRVGVPLDLIKAEDIRMHTVLKWHTKPGPMKSTSPRIEYLYDPVHLTALLSQDFV
jgi:hypothetical protein